jgi:endonuclease-3
MASLTRKLATKKQRALEVLVVLKRLYPDATCSLNYETPVQLLVATILSAQCTDVRVNMVTPALFKKYPTPLALSQANQEDVEVIVRSTGFYQSKAKNLIGMGRIVTENFGGVIPHELEDLVTLPGVGRKTGNVLRSVVFDLPGLAVDTHVGRLSRRMGLTTEEDPVKVEKVLNAFIPPAEWGRFSLRLILHGRRVCDAKKPKCDICEMEDICPSSNMPTKSKSK